jgi:hypothetical protein
MRTRNGRIATPLAAAVLAIALAAPCAHADRATGTGGAAAGVPAVGAPPRIKPIHAFAPPGKPVAPIALGYEVSAQPALGVPFEVRISARGGDGIVDLALTVRAGPGLEVGTPELTKSSADGTARTWAVAATAFANGTLCLNLLVQGTAGTKHQARNLVIPIRIGTQTATDEPAAQQSTRGSTTERVIVLPAARGR